MATDIKKYHFKPGLPQEFEIVDIGQLYAQFGNELTTPHRTGFYHILWFQSGSPLHMVDFKPVSIKSNSLLFLNKDTVQRFDKIGNFDAKAILFTDSFFCQSDADTRFLRSTILFNDLFSVCQLQLEQSTSPFSDLFLQMEKEISNSKDAYQEVILQNLLHNFLLLSDRERRKQNFTELKKGADLDYVLQFKDLLENQYRTEKLVSQYAYALSITEKRLNQATAKIMGKTPKSIIDGRIILEAKRLLAHTHQNIKEIGFSLGFEESTNFIKFFKRHTQTTPAAFRESLDL